MAYDRASRYPADAIACQQGRASGCSVPDRRQRTASAAYHNRQNPMFARKCSVPATLNSSRMRIRAASRAWVGRAGAAMVLALVCGCAVGPDFVVPAPPDVKSYAPHGMPKRTVASSGADGTEQFFAVDRDIPGEWWTLFRSRPLRMTRLV